eukprot:CAMPEP_0119530620 /NCGR_PEP_ID=MMETSP1344-20130328/44440_1 /TAXON_ID=236787 /ORGANISM="Florenciella parvula, Strain CCMP2471" /LENGTH=48 /DNA_ID= /DNA_START= /DNA_END= /DNA_ORIENTATION=
MAAGFGPLEVRPLFSHTSARRPPQTAPLTPAINWMMMAFSIAYASGSS